MDKPTNDLPNNSQGDKIFKLEQNIVLIGFMGAGKSTIGTFLASLLEMKFVETDELIEQELGLPVSAIFERYGEGFFRDKETEIIQELTNLAPGTAVISTGGGVVLRPVNFTALKEAGLVFFLEASAEEVYKRLKDKGDRPLLQGGSIQEKIVALMEKRKDLYNKADFKISTNQKEPAEIVREIIDLAVAAGRDI